MAKTAKKAAPSDTEELRRWCIEQAIRWPMIGPGNNFVSQGGGYMASAEADVLGRATRILNWVRS